MSEDNTRSHTTTEAAVKPQLVVNDHEEQAQNQMTLAHDDSQGHAEHDDEALEAVQPINGQPTSTNNLASKRARRRKKAFNWGIAGVGFVIVCAATAALTQLGHIDTSDRKYTSDPINSNNPHIQPDPTPPEPVFDWFGLFKNLPATSGKVNVDLVNGAVGGVLNGVILLGIGGLLYAKATRRRYITFDGLGMYVSDDRELKVGKTRIIPWKCMQQVEVHYPKGLETEAMDTAQLAEADSASPKSTPISKKSIVHVYVDDGSITKIKWKDIIATNEPGQFINAMRTWAPEACSDTVFPDSHLAPSKIDSGAYTQLWFKYYSAGSERRRTTHLVAGETLQEGRFEIAGQIGGGGQGMAYLAVDKQATAEQASEIVLKEYILPVHRGQQVLQATIDKLEQEAAILRKINHNNIVHLLDSFVEDHRGYLVMDYITGRSLKDLVAAEGSQPEHAILPIALQICDVLTYLHTLAPPIVHRDLTPDNLILQNDGVVKLVDFNVAHQLESAATATVVGKHCYIPPEQFRGRPTAQSDLYALGCTLYYMLVGEEPEPLTQSRPRLKNANISEDLNDIIAIATALDATKRYPSAEALRADLLQICPPELLRQHEQYRVINART
jgi:tRNA A-37 threonylcarbamoyl transferase component Bud32